MSLPHPALRHPRRPPVRRSREEAAFVALCALVYFASYLTRGTYAAALAEIIRDMGVSKSETSFAVAGSFFTYGLGQLLSGYLGDRFSPRRIMALGLAAASLSCVLLPLLESVAAMNLLWCCNGFFQSLIWPSLVCIMTRRLGVSQYAHACAYVIGVASAATVLLYLIVPACIVVSGWRLAFYLCGGFGLLCAAAWLLGVRSDSAAPQAAPAQASAAQAAPAQPPAQPPAPGSLRRLVRSSGLLLMMPAILLQGILRDGVTTWMPVYISENYGMSTSASILTTTILPLLGIFSIAITAKLEDRRGNEAATATLMFGIGFLAMAVLALPVSLSVAVGALLMALVTACMHGVNLMLVSTLPAHFAPYGCVSTVAGLLNTFTYVGSAVSVYGVAAVTERAGWSAAVIIWAVAALLGTLLCLRVSGAWGRFRSREAAQPPQ